ncbi:MAG: MlaD family protein [Lentisphaeria bacterium]|nr:MlaD family protein [Lentisphaeria bacterium]
MKKSTKQVTTIGIFVIAALVLLVGLIVAMGGNKWTQEYISYRLYFTNSVKGLSVGAPVMFRGISIGEVSGINLAPQDHLLEEDASNLPQDFLPVEIHIKIFPERLGYYSNGFLKFLNRPSTNKTRANHFLGIMVKDYNLRAELGTLSLLTGQIYVSLNFASNNLNEPEGLVAKLWQKGIIPSNLSFLERLSSKMNEETFAEQIASLKNATKQLAQFVNDGGAEKLFQDIATISENLSASSSELKDNLPQLIEKMQSISNKFDIMMERVNGTLERIQPDIENTVADTKTLVRELNGFLDESRPDVTALFEKFNAALNVAQDDLERTRRLLDSAQAITEPGSLEHEKLEDTLNECQRVLTQLANFLELMNKNPQALILGK